MRWRVTLLNWKLTPKIEAREIGAGCVKIWRLDSDFGGFKCGSPRREFWERGNRGWHEFGSYGKAGREGVPEQRFPVTGSLVR